MATVQKRQQRRADGSLGPLRWTVRYRTPDGEQLRKTFTRKVDADRFAASVETEKARGDFIDPRLGAVTFGEFTGEWRAIQVHRRSTADQVESYLRNHVLPVLGDRPMSSIRKSEIQAWVKGCPLAPSTVETVFRYISAIFATAVEDRILSSNPCAGVKLPKAAPREVVPPTTEEIETLLEAVGERYRALVLLAAGSGLRQGECFGLTVDRVDFLAGRTVRVEQQLVMPNRGPLYVGPPKTAASYRTVPLPGVVLEGLAAHLAAFPAESVELLDVTAGEPGTVAAHRLVFTNDRGEPIRRSRFNDGVWKPALRRAGLRDDLGFHDLRHYYASLLIRHGESVKVVQKRLGHASAMETLDTYGHLWPDSEDRTREAVEMVLGRSGQVAAAR